MIELNFSIGDNEDPPSYSLLNIKRDFSEIIQDSVFAKFEKNTLISIVFVDDSTMQKLNNQYRGKNVTTDVLSFPLNENLEDEFLLGEIIISTDKAKVDAETFGITFDQEVLLLFVHGVSHLLGYDHISDQQEEEMKEIENKLMNRINLRKVL